MFSVRPPTSIERPTVLAVSQMGLEMSKQHKYGKMSEWYIVRRYILW